MSQEMGNRASTWFVVDAPCSSAQFSVKCVPAARICGGSAGTTCEVSCGAKRTRRRGARWLIVFWEERGAAENSRWWKQAPPDDCVHESAAEGFSGRV